MLPCAQGKARKEIPVFSRRESKRRAILKLLDRIPLRPMQARAKRKRGQSRLPEFRQASGPAPEKLI